jgi:serine/threonine-protein kinase
VPVQSGTRIGPYEILSAIGAGGMGEVYRARDTKLGRDVAIKVLPEAFAGDPERLARFQREAQVLATLNHPHIAAIYGLEDAGGISALAMELVEGDDLAQRLAKGPLQLADTLAIATQLAQALEAAHDQSVIHRDLKPANIKVRTDGAVKVLDFGLAKLVEGPGTLRSGSVSMPPTLTSPVGVTGAGMILGTAAYMSPEQAKGRAADKRCDIWAFGCVLFEMLAGTRPFASDDVSEVLAFVITKEPNWSALRATTPAPLRKLLRRCLEKDPRRRLRDIGDALPELEEAAAPASTSPAALTTTSDTRGRWLERTLAAILLVATCAGTGFVVWRARPSVPATVTRFALNLPVDQQITGSLGRTVAFSPDGSRLVYVANNRLYLRAMSEDEAKPVPGTEAATVRGGLMFTWSPDSRAIAYVSDQTIRKIPIDGGGATVICSIERNDGSDGVINTTYLSWTKAGIVFVGRNGIMRVAPDGGTPERIAAVDDSQERVQNPQLLPDGRTLLFGVVRMADLLMDRWDNADVVVQSIPSGQRRVVVHGVTSPQYVATGHLLYASGNTIVAAPFDATRQQLTGPAVSVVDGVRRSLSTSISQFSVADNGSLVYQPGPPGSANVRRSDLVKVSMTGAIARLPMLENYSYELPRYSPDGTQLAFGADSGQDADIWIYAMSGESAMRRLTFGGHNRHPIWSRDGHWITFQSDRDGDFGLFRQRADGSGAVERLTKAEHGTAHVPESWSPNGELLLYASNTGGLLNARTGARNPGMISTLLLLSLKDRKSEPFAGIVSRDRAANAEFSPDGGWVAYNTGANPSVVFVRPFPVTSVVYQVSKGDDGHHPWWSRDGRKLFYVPGPDALSSVSVTTRPAFSFSDPAALPRAGMTESPVTSRNIDISADGTQLVGVTTAGMVAGGPRFQVVLNWFEELNRLVPLNRP